VKLMDPTPTDKRIDDLSDRVGRFEQNVDRRFDRIEDKVDERFAKVDDRFDKVDDRFDKVGERFAKVDDRFDNVGEQFMRLATKEELAEIGARLDRWGKVVSSGVVVIVGGVILKLIGA